MRMPFSLKFSLQSASFIRSTPFLSSRSGFRLAQPCGDLVLTSARTFHSRASLSTTPRLSAIGRTGGHLDPQRIYYSTKTQHPRSRHLKASSSALYLIAAAAVALSAYYTLYSRKAVPEQSRAPSALTEDMTADIAPGRPGNLTPEQEEKLRRLWQLILQVCAVGQENDESNPAAADEKAEDEDGKKKKSRVSLFSRKGKKESGADPTPGTPANAPVLNLGKDGEADKYGQTKAFYETLASQSPQSIRDTIWSMVKHDHPDALVLRFLRARKWDVERALIMFVSTMRWRAQEMKVDEDIMRNGEAAAVATAATTSDPAEKKRANDFLGQMRKGISYVHGQDKQGRPLCFVNVRLHKQGEAAEEALERYTVYLIETCRMLLQDSVDTATIVFNMTDFSMANMDYAPVKFMIKCFEANYPECLGAVLVHKAPWIFQGIWKVIRGWLDPVVANKVHFTNTVKEMEEFIPIKHIPKDLEGEEDWTYQYVEPAEGENAKLGDTETRDRLLAEREKLYREYEEATLEWIRSGEKGDGNVAEIKARRNAIAEKLRAGYWDLDPYLRARSYYDRTGVLLPGGKLNWYPDAKPGEAKDAAAPAVETTGDDVD